jgi:hypothetical protein
MAAAAEQSDVQQSILEAKADIREAKEQLQGATGDERVALQQRLAALEQRLAALEQQKLLLMQQQSGATGWAHSQGAGLPVASLQLWTICSTYRFVSEQGFSRKGLQDEAAAATCCPEAVAAAGSLLQGCMIMWHNLQIQHCIPPLVNQPGLNAAAVFSFKIAESTSIWQCASYTTTGSEACGWIGHNGRVPEQPTAPALYCICGCHFAMCPAPVSLHVSPHLTCG